ncbi:MAG: hypothetical protein AB7O67_23275 [Vicinamibacterales bacterium]
MPTYAEISRRLSALYVQRSEWCGLPMPIPGLTLTLEPKNPFRDICEQVEAAQAEPAPAAESDDPVEVVNVWFSRTLQRDVVIARDRTGVRAYTLGTSVSDRMRAMVQTIGAAAAWHLDTEMTAIDLLATLVKPHIFDSYLMTGMFLETSQRSQVTYVFRRARPTLALRPSLHGGDMVGLCALCLHPIGYYQETFAGSMTPTDDVIAHLMLMRGDEPMFWRRANQHPLWHPTAGL